MCSLCGTAMLSESGRIQLRANLKKSFCQTLHSTLGNGLSIVFFVWEYMIKSSCKAEVLTLIKFATEYIALSSEFTQQLIIKVLEKISQWQR